MIGYDFKAQINSVKAMHEIGSMFEHDGHQIVKSGGYRKVNCPFHKEKTPSCVIYDDHFWCFSCHAGGDIFHYVMRRDGCDFKSALRTLSGGMETARVSTNAASRVAMPIKTKPELLPPEFFSERMARWSAQTDAEEVVLLASELQVDAQSLFRLEIAWADEHQAWAIPMRNSAREMVGIRLRDNQGKKWAVKGSRNGLFIPSGEPGKDLAVTEGPTDCAAALSMGLYAIGKPMALMNNEAVIEFARAHRVRRVIIVPDNDTPGLTGASKLIDVCYCPCCELVLPTKDIREFSKLGGGRMLLDSLLNNQEWRYPKRWM